MIEFAVAATGLHKRYGQTPALDGFDLAVAGGTIHGLLGPNGAGKTTAVRALATLLTVDAGTAAIGGYGVGKSAGAVRERIGLVGQTPAVDDALTGRQNLVLFGRLCGLAKAEAGQRAQELLDRFGLDGESADRPVSGYSGGMRRRLDIAVSLVLRPTVLFLDEPTTGLDPRGRNEVWRAVREVAAAGTTVLLTTQYLDEADQLADHVSVMNHGRVIAAGTPVELKRKLGADRVEVVVLHDGDLDRTAASLAAVIAHEPTIDRDRRSITVEVPAGAASLAAVVRALDEAGIAVDDLTLRRPTLDEVFLALTAPGAAHVAVAAPVVQPSPTPPPPRTRRRNVLREGWLIAGRDVLHWVREPWGLIFGLAFTVLLLLMFGLLLGGAIEVPGGGEYIDFLLPGMFALTMLFGLESTMTAMAEDAKRGITDRLRSLPISSGAVALGRAGADMAYSALNLAVLMVGGLIVGWRAPGAAGAIAVAVVLLLWLRFSLLWVGIGLTFRGTGAVTVLQVLVWPVGFLSAVFVSPETMPGWLGTVAAWNPVSATAAAARDLFGNPTGLTTGVLADHAVLLATLWPLVITLVFLPLSARAYRRLA